MKLQGKVINFDAQVVITNCKDAIQDDKASSEYGSSSSCVDSKTKCAELIDLLNNQKKSQGNNCLESGNELKQLIDNEKGSEVDDPSQIYEKESPCKDNF